MKSGECGVLEESDDGFFTAAVKIVMETSASTGIAWIEHIQLVM